MLAGAGRLLSFASHKGTALWTRPRSRGSLVQNPLVGALGTDRSVGHFSQFLAAIEKGIANLLFFTAGNGSRAPYAGPTRGKSRYPHLRYPLDSNAP